MISGKKVYFRAIELSDLEQMRQWRNLSELRKYFREYREISEAMQEGWYQSIQKDKDQINFAVCEKVSDELIGYAGFSHISWLNRSAEFGNYIAPEFFGKGFGKDLVKTLIRHGFEELNFNRIWMECYSNNPACSFYNKCGFINEGIMRETYFYDGQYWDSQVKSMLAEEYFENKKRGEENEEN